LDCPARAARVLDNVVVLGFGRGRESNSAFARRRGGKFLANLARVPRAGSFGEFFWSWPGRTVLEDLLCERAGWFWNGRFGPLPGFATDWLAARHYAGSLPGRAAGGVNGMGVAWDEDHDSRSVLRGCHFNRSRTRA